MSLLQILWHYMLLLKPLILMRCCLTRQCIQGKLIHQNIKGCASPQSPCGSYATECSHHLELVVTANIAPTPPPYLLSSPLLFSIPFLSPNVQRASEFTMIQCKPHATCWCNKLKITCMNKIALTLFMVGYLMGVSFRLWTHFLVCISTSAWSYHWNLELKLLWLNLFGLWPQPHPLISELSMVRALRPAHAPPDWMLPTSSEKVLLQGEGSASWACLC